MDRIVVVDDDALILQTLSRVLETEGYQVTCHQDSQQALFERDFTVVIADFVMPHIDGVELLDSLRQTSPKGIRVLMTAAGDFKIASEAINRGEVYRILAKPWSVPDVISCVRQAVQHFHLLEENARLSSELAEKNAELVSINRNLERLVIERTNGLLDGMISALDYRDTETQWHSRRVSLYSRRIGEELGGLSADELAAVEQGALLHDVGKIGVRDSILHKPGPLTPDEWQEMRRHPEFGYRMLEKMPYLREASLVVLQHQERFDGHGYPKGLKGKEIAVGARIFAVADTLDAITSDRPYRKGRPIAAAREEILRCRGSQFDPEVVDAFLRVSDECWLEIREQVEKLEAAESSDDALPPAAMLRANPWGRLGSAPNQASAVKAVKA